MDKAIRKLIGEWPYFLDNVLMGVRVIFFPNYLLVLSLLMLHLRVNKEMKWNNYKGIEWNWMYLSKGNEWKKME